MLPNRDKMAAFEKVLELSEPRFYAAMAAIWNTIAVLEQFCGIATKKFTTETAF